MVTEAKFMVGTELEWSEWTCGKCGQVCRTEEEAEQCKHTRMQYRSEREDAFEKLLKPITWPPSWSILGRQDLVRERRTRVQLVYPFLMASEKLEADAWLERENHNGLWE